jgi:tritrans,polycis-undecaprenyl-diphosphate synthase [geranylgeranyl-diphosphate specific]
MSFTLRNPAYTFYERILKSRILTGVPVDHVAIIQDGNRRFARQKGLSKFLGHSLGADTSERVMDWCLEMGVRHLTLYAFSTENFSRNEAEKRYLFDLIRDKFVELKRSKKIHNNQIRVRAIGRVEMLPHDLQVEICRTQEATQEYDNMYLNVALAYGCQRELIDAARSLARQVLAGKIRTADVDEDLIARHLYPQDGIPVPKVDLIIRTGGDLRTSNFLPWQSNGNECAAYFCAPYWPEFRKIDFLRAIRTAQTRASGQQA